MKLKRIASLIITLMLSNVMHAMAPETPDDSALFKITTADDSEYKLAYSLLKLSPTIQGFLGDLGFDQETPVPLPTITAADFENINKTLVFFSPIAKKYGPEELQKNIVAMKSLDLKIRALGLNNQQLIRFIAHLNFLAIQSLIDAALRVLQERELTPDDILSLDAFGKPVLEEFWKGHDAKNWLESTYQNNPQALPQKQISGYIIDEDNNHLITWSHDNGTIGIWPLSNLQESIALPHENITDAIYSKKYIVSRSFDTGIVKIWNKENLSEKPKTLQHENLFDVALDYDNEYLATESAGVIKIWNLNNLDEAPKMILHPLSGSIFAGNKLITWSYTGTVRIWPLDNLEKDAEFSKTLSSSVDYEVSTTSDTKIVQLSHKNRNFNEPMLSLGGKYLVIIAPPFSFQGEELETSKTFVWDMNDLAKPRVITLPAENRFTYFPESSLLFSHNLDQITIWDLKTFATSTIGYGSTQLELYENLLIAWNEYNKGTIKIWNISDAPNTVQAIASLEHPRDGLFNGLFSGVYLVQISPNSQYIVSANPKSLKIWDFKNLTKKPTLLRHSESNNFFISNNLDLIDKSFDAGTINIWDLKLLPFIENQTPDQMYLYLLLYFSDETESLKVMSDGAKQQFKAILNGLPRELQGFLTRIKPNTVNALTS